MQTPAFLQRLKQGLDKTRVRLAGRLAQGIRRGGAVDEAFLDELEEILIQADVGVGATEALLDQVREAARGGELRGREQVPGWLVARVAERLAAAGSRELARGPAPPAVWMFVGVNGSGKTTTVGKLAAQERARGHSVVVAAADTFRSAAIEQLAIWAERAGAALVRHQPGADPGAVAFDAVQAARSRGADVVLIDTAGRLQNKENLMRELAKIRRVTERALERPPDEVLLVLDAVTGQNGLAQARAFREAVALTGVVLTKLDGSARGGVALAIATELGLPVKLVGVGEDVEDLGPFDPEVFARGLLEI